MAWVVRFRLEWDGRGWRRGNGFDPGFLDTSDYPCAGDLGMLLRCHRCSRCSSCSCCCCSPVEFGADTTTMGRKLSFILCGGSAICARQNNACSQQPTCHPLSSPRSHPPSVRPPVRPLTLSSLLQVLTIQSSPRILPFLLRWTLFRSPNLPPSLSTSTYPPPPHPASREYSRTIG